MNSPGSPVEPVELPPETPQEDEEERGGWLSWLMIVGGGVLLILVLVLGGRLVSVFYAILFPPLPPIPASVTEISHQSEDYGVDVWEYTTADSVLETVKFYESQGATCGYADGLRSLGSSSRCTGRTDFSIFTMQWQADITYTSASDRATRIRLSREVFWIGTGRQESSSIEVTQTAP